MRDNIVAKTAFFTFLSILPVSLLMILVGNASGHEELADFFTSVVGYWILIGFVCALIIQVIVGINKPDPKVRGITIWFKD